jgi:hypothetical protein
MNRLGWLSLTVSVAVCSLVQIGLVPSARADSITYRYVGQKFDEFSGHPQATCPPNCRITGSITLPNPLPPSSKTTLPAGTMFSFSDGVSTITNFTASPTSSPIVITTNAAGEINGWDIMLNTDGTPAERVDITTRFIEGKSTLDSFFGPGTTANSKDASIRSSPGTWTTPEPASLILLTSGLVGLSGFYWVRKGKTRT